MGIMVHVFNHHTRKWEDYDLKLSQDMPYTGGFLAVKDFRGQSRSAYIWSDTRALEAFRRACRYFGSRIPVNYAFRRIEEGGHKSHSAHYAGMAFDMGKWMPATERCALRKLLLREHLFSYIEPSCIAPIGIHAQVCTPVSIYPNASVGSCGTHICVLQDALRIVGAYRAALTGCFCDMTKKALCRFQHDNHICASGIADRNTWNLLLRAASSHV